MRPRATSDAGIWRLPDGEARYAAAAQRDYDDRRACSADEIDEMGVELSAQLSSETNTILKGEGLTRGSVAEVSSLCAPPRSALSEHRWP